MDFPIKFGTLAIAGQRDGRRVIVRTNLKWGWNDIDDIKAKYKFEKFYILNDFESNAYGATCISVEDHEECVMLNKGVKTEKKPLMIVGPGTGLGSAVMTYSKADGGYTVHSGEGGHVEFTVTNDLELRLRSFAIQYWQEKRGITLHRVASEKLASGPALPLLYEFFKLEHPELEAILQPSSGEEEVKSKDIIEAFYQKDPLCVKVIEQFTKNLAVMVSDLALVVMAQGGIYLCGGVAVSLKEYFLSPDCIFMDVMINKGVLEDFIKSIPIYLLMHEPGLDGAEQYTYQGLVNNYSE